MVGITPADITSKIFFIPLLIWLPRDLELKHNMNFSLIRSCSRYAYAKKETINLTKDFLTPTAGGD